MTGSSVSMSSWWIARGAGASPERGRIMARKGRIVATTSKIKPPAVGFRIQRLRTSAAGLSLRRARVQGIPRGDREWEHWPGRRTPDERIRHRLKALFAATDDEAAVEAVISDRGRELEEQTERLQADDREPRAARGAGRPASAARSRRCSATARPSSTSGRPSWRALAIELRAREEAVRELERDVALRDIAAGTSSRSSRLIHGGLRYLEQFRFGLVREALAERTRLLTLAPHLVRIEPLLFPIYGIPFASKAFYDAGLTLYDILGARHDGGWHRRLSKADTLDLAPTLRREGLRGGLVYHDGVEDDARYTLAVARTAIAAGGVAVTRVRATGLRTDPRPGAIDALRAEDLTTGAELEIRTRAIVDATGVWAAEPDHPFKGGSMRILPSRGAHLVVPRERIPNTMGLTIRVPGKIVFLVPWPDHWLIGTTDAPFEGPAARPSAAGWEVDRLLDTVNATMDVDLTRADVVGTYAGLRPLIAPSDGSTVKASREHRVTVGAERRRPDRWRQVHDLPGDGPRRHRRGPRRRPRESARATRPSAGWSGRPTPTPWPGSPASSRRSRPSARSGRRRRHASSPGTGRRRRRSSRSARSCDLIRPLVAGPPVPRGRGRLGRPPRAGACRSMTSWPGGPGWPRSCPIAARRSLRASPRSSAAELGWGAARQALEVENYLACARREFSVAAPDRRRADAAAPSGGTERRPPSTDDGARAVRSVIAPSPSGAILAAMDSLDDLQRAFFDGLYTNRIPVAIGVGRRRGGRARRRMAARLVRAPRDAIPVRPGVLLVVVLIVGPADSATTWPRRSGSGPRSSSPARSRPHRPSRPSRPPRRRTHRPRASAADRPTRPPVASERRRRSRRRSPRAGSPPDRSTAPTISTSAAARPRSSRRHPGSYILRLEDFSVRNGPDLYVYLSPAVDDYATGALELGQLKATDGAFGYALPAGHRPRRFRQRDHLVQAVLAPVRGGAVGRRLTLVHGRKSGLGKRENERVPSRRETPRKGPWPDT